MCDLKETCSIEAPFKCHLIELCIQNNGHIDSGKKTVRIAKRQTNYQTIYLTHTQTQTTTCEFTNEFKSCELLSRIEKCLFELNGMENWR